MGSSLGFLGGIVSLKYRRVPSALQNAWGWKSRPAGGVTVAPVVGAGGGLVGRAALGVEAAVDDAPIDEVQQHQGAPHQGLARPVRRPFEVDLELQAREPHGLLDERLEVLGMAMTTKVRQPAPPAARDRAVLRGRVTFHRVTVPSFLPPRRRGGRFVPR